MSTEYAIVWQDADDERFVGRIGVTGRELIMDGTATTPTREHRQIRMRQSDIAGVTVERVADGAGVRIEATSGVYLVELLAGGRGAALALAKEIMQ